MEQSEANLAGSKSDFTLEVHSRDTDGSAGARRLRNEGFIPTVVYSHGEGSWPMSVSSREFIRLAEKATSAQVFILKSNLSTINDRPAIVKEVQLDRVKGRVLHVDFQALKENEEIVVQVPLKFVGEAAGVKEDGGILSVAAHALGLRCLPRAIPNVVEVQVSALRIGDSIHAKELKLPQGVKLAGKEDETIVSVIVVKQVVETTTTAVAADGAAPAEGAAAPAEGAAAAPAADAAKDAAKAKK